MKTCVLLIALLLAPTAALSQLEWRVSVKFILDANGNRPTVGFLRTDQDVRAFVDFSNAVLDGSGRGYQIDLTEIVEVPGQSQWFMATLSTATRDAMEQAAEADPLAWSWREDAINVYITGVNSGPSGICSFPGSAEIIVLAQSSPFSNLLHEMGHFFNLCHTQGCFCSGCNDCNDPNQDDDDLDDTLPDTACWTSQDQVALNAFGDVYVNLSAVNQKLVDDVFFNIMSYHSNLDRFTDDQLDRLTDASNYSRGEITTGRTVFVDTEPPVVGQETGASNFPYDSVNQGLIASSPGDILLVRTGAYSELISWSQPVTLRASRGLVTISP